MSTKLRTQLAIWIPVDGVTPDTDLRGRGFEGALVMAGSYPAGEVVAAEPGQGGVRLVVDVEVEQVPMVSIEEAPGKPHDHGTERADTIFRHRHERGHKFHQHNELPGGLTWRRA